MKSKKFQGFVFASALGMIAFIALVLKMNPGDLPILCNLWFIYQGAITGSFYGFRFGEQWANAKKA